MLHRIKILALAFLISVPLAACEYLATADTLSQKAVKGVCTQPEGIRQVERRKFAEWGLWAKCVQPGTLYDDFELIKKEVVGHADETQIDNKTGGEKIAGDEKAGGEKIAGDEKAGGEKIAGPENIVRPDRPGRARAGPIREGRSGDERFRPARGHGPIDRRAGRNLAL